MATTNDDDDKPKKKGGKKPPQGLGHLIPARPFAWGEIRTVLELMHEFPPTQLHIEVYQMTRSNHLQVSCDTQERALFINHLLELRLGNQRQIERAYNLPFLEERPWLHTIEHENWEKENAWQKHEREKVWEEEDRRRKQKG